MPASFVHLHAHSDYSLLEGAVKPAGLVKAAVEDGHPALALTDHGNLCGAVEFYKSCKDAGIKPILGSEFYVAPKSRHDREKNPVAGFNLILLAMDNEGYGNLIRLSTRAHAEGFYYHPRIDYALLEELNQGLICLGGDLWGEPAYYARHDDLDEARAAILRMKALFGDRYYLEIQRTGRDTQDRVNRHLVALAEETGVPLVATQDVHYLRPEDQEAARVLRCIKMDKVLREDQLRTPADLHFRTTREMEELFADLPDAVARTAEIADRCTVELDLDQTHLPRFEPPEGFDEASYFEHLCLEGAKARYGTPLSEEVKERLAYEQGVIARMGFIAYFLITWDFMRYAREEDIPVGPGRGSAAGSIVAYVLQITNVCPLEYDLLFERFLNPARISMPDIDIDFCKDGRGQVIKYVQEKYGGEDCVSQIITFGRMNARAVIRDVGRVLEVPLHEVDRLAKKVPGTPGSKLRDALEKDEDFRKEVEGNEEYTRLLDLALRLEGLNRNASKHAAGIVVGSGPLEDFVPLYKVGEELATQFTMDRLEEIGLLKMDFLGLRTLTIIQKALDNIELGGREAPDMETLPLDHAPTYEMLARGDALGVFQVESSGMRDIMRKIGPNCFDDLSTIVALYRPGPMGSGMMDMFIERKNGREEVTYPHPSLEELLEETKGVVVYQEQVMRITSILAGFDLPTADKLRKAMGKKKPEILAKYRDKFVTGCVENGIDKNQASEIWDQLEHFAGYGFNKSHTVAYGLITYQTAWLKKNYPLEFMAALLTCEMGDQDKLAEYIEESRRMGIDVLPPHVSISDWEFTVEGDNIRYGLAAVKGVGRGAADAVVAARGDDAFGTVFDLCERVDLHAVNRSTLEALAKAGALDAPGAHRAQIAAVLDRALQMGQGASRDRAAGQLGLFGASADVEIAPDYPDVPPWPDSELLQLERDAIGYYATDHPLSEHERLLRLLANCTTRGLPDAKERTQVRLGGLIRASRTVIVKSGRNEGRRMGFFQLEDFHGTVECVLFARTFAEHGHLMTSDRIVIVEGKVDHSREPSGLHVDRLVPIEEAPRTLAQGVLVRLHDVEAPTLERLKSTCGANHGPLPVVIEFAPESDAVARVKAGHEWGVEASESLIVGLCGDPSVERAEFLARAP